MRMYKYCGTICGLRWGCMRKYGGSVGSVLRNVGRAGEFWGYVRSVWENILTMNMSGEW